MNYSMFDDPMYDNCSSMHCSDLISVLVIVAYVVLIYCCCNKHDVVEGYVINNDDGLILEEFVPVGIVIHT